MPRAGFPPLVSPHTAPAPEGRGRRPKAGWGLRGGIYEFRHLRGGGSPPPRSPPRAIVTPVHCPGEPGDTPRSPPVLRWVGAITRTDAGVQPSLHLADSQPGTHCTHVVSSRQCTDSPGGRSSQLQNPRNPQSLCREGWEMRSPIDLIPHDDTSP